MGKIGNILEDGTVEKEYFGQGYIYRDDEAFDNKKGICYIAEYGSDNINKDDNFSTYETMIAETTEAYKMEGVDPAKYPIENMIMFVWELLDWQMFSTLLYETIDRLEDDCFL